MLKVLMKTVLLIEDNPDDVFVMKMACQRTGIPHLLRVVTDGVMAIDYLSGNGEYADRTGHPLPDVVFLDIKMPKRDGHEVLKWIRSQPGLKNLPVVMLTVSTQTEDVERAYQLGVTSYLQKVACLAEFGQGVRVIMKYWLELNVGPSEG
jgi:CheY-like chemotaxis protein